MIDDKGFNVNIPEKCKPVKPIKNNDSLPEVSLANLALDEMSRLTTTCPTCPRKWTDEEVRKIVEFNSVAKCIASWCARNGEEFFPNPLAKEIVALIFKRMADLKGERE